MPGTEDAVFLDSTLLKLSQRSERKALRDLSTSPFAADLAYHVSTALADHETDPQRDEVIKSRFLSAVLRDLRQLNGIPQNIGEEQESTVVSLETIIALTAARRAGNWSRESAAEPEAALSGRTSL